MPERRGREDNCNSFSLFLSTSLSRHTLSDRVTLDYCIGLAVLCFLHSWAGYTTALPQTFTTSAMTSRCLALLSWCLGFNFLTLPSCFVTARTLWKGLKVFKKRSLNWFHLGILTIVDLLSESRLWIQLKHMHIAKARTKVDVHECLWINILHETCRQWEDS